MEQNRENSNELISIIVPIYNSISVKRCMDSIKAQTYPYFEVILIDDGSSIDMKELLNNYLKDERFRYYYKNNGGVSSARNEGIKYAKGKYITFLDSDDSLQQNILLEAVSFMKQTDIVLWGANRVYNEVIIKSDHLEERRISIDDLVQNVIYTLNPEKYGMYVRACWGKMFKTDIIQQKGLKFHEKIYIGEDALFVLEYLRCVQKAYLLGKNGYCYEVSENSATAKYKPDLIEQCNLQIRYLRNYLIIQSEPQLDVAFSNFKWWMFNMLLDNSVAGVKRKEIKLSSLFEDAYKFYRKNCLVMIEKKVDDKLVLPQFRKQYKRASKYSSALMLFFWFEEKVKRKML